MMRALSGLYGAAVTFVGSLALVVQNNETLADVSTAEWLTVTAAVLGSAAVAQWLGDKQPVGGESTGKHSA